MVESSTNRQSVIKKPALKTTGFSIGSHLVDAPVALAPMSGITDKPFRSAVMAYQAGYVVSEMIASDRLVAGEEAARLKLEGAGLDLHIVQIAGCIPALVADGARIAVDAGAQVIDINMGCPAKRVIGGYAGSALMRDLDHAIAIIDSVVDAVNVPVTLKMRLGWDDSSINAPELARRAQDSGIELVTVHARTRQQFYKGRADWSKVASVRDAVSIPVVVNGDIDSGPTALEALRQSGADAVMIGRASVGKPWLLAEIAAQLQGRSFSVPELDRQHAGLLQLYRDLCDHYGETVGLRHARKHLAAALDVACATAGLAADMMAKDRQIILTSIDPAMVEETVSSVFQYLSVRRAA